MLPPRSVLVAFALRFFGILAVYLLPWAPVGEAYSAVAVAIGNAIVHAVPAERLTLTFVHAESPPDADISTAFSAELDVVDRTNGASVRLALDLRSLTYVPMAVFVALAIAAPIWERRRGLRVLLGGLAVLHVFFAFALASMIAFFLARTRPVPMLELGAGARFLFDVVDRVLIAPPGMAFAVPGAVWLVMLWLTPEAAPPSAHGDESVAHA